MKLKTSSYSSTPIPYSSLALPVGMSIYIYQPTAPSALESIMISGSFFTLNFVTVVRRRNGSPISFIILVALTSLSNVPGTPLKLSCVLASGPSILIATTSVPASFNFTIFFLFRSGVVLGAMVTFNPVSFAYPIKSNISPRISALPPVIRRIG